MIIIPGLFTGDARKHKKRISLRSLHQAQATCRVVLWGRSPTCWVEAEREAQRAEPQARRAKPEAGGEFMSKHQ